MNTYIYICNEETRNTVNFCDLDAILGAAILNFLFRTHYILKVSRPRFFFPGAEHGNRLFDKKILDLKLFVVEKIAFFAKICS